MTDTTCAERVQSGWHAYRCSKPRGHGPGQQYCKGHAVMYDDATTTWYRVDTGTFPGPQIVREVPVVKASKKSIVIKGDGRRNYRQAIESRFSRYFPTKKLALEFAQKMCQGKIQKASDALRTETKRLKEIRQLQEKNND